MSNQPASHATPDDYADFLSSLEPGDRARLVAEGITGPPEDGIMGRTLQIRDCDGLPKFQKNGSSLAQFIPEPEDDDDPQISIRPDLGEGLRKVFLWILIDEDSPEKFYKYGERIIRRLSVVLRALNLGGFGETTLSQMAMLAGVSRASMSKIACDFRDEMGSRFLAGHGARENFRRQCSRVTRQAWDARKAVESAED